ncbi:hypothetical protein PF005_g24067 [Phytophthora fragariae]|uniref:RxLR effector protein n=2 Tax=Phytophthora fragariae TaxID=53985 RepID=A0A6A3WEU9_9STRA|nr:hypothetical protein PF011_g23504 [Phytophthora fragariae]KAE9075906.1 hypothetical protein PF010_g24120 [Phytophthora fragariae]KAE9178478.1 hypothetical protein PF005_g24067 [Phytophthora fragariae]KAE9281196.1 hypothetical protein PF001_g23887 [Phytophthora fragariae]
MRVNSLLLLAAVVIFASAHAASATLNADQTKMVSSREASTVSRLLRKHEAYKKQDDDDEERAFNLEMIGNVFKFDSKKIDDLAPKMEIEMTNLNKLDNVVVDAKKSTTSLISRSWRSWKSKKTSLSQARLEMLNGCVKDEQAIDAVLAWYKFYAKHVVD